VNFSGHVAQQRHVLNSGLDSSSSVGFCRHLVTEVFDLRKNDRCVREQVRCMMVSKIEHKNGNSGGSSNTDVRECNRN
jgi:hypothetical protein